MFNIGGGELFLIVIVFLMFFGAKSIPSVARSLGKGIRDFKDAANGLQRDIQNSTQDIRKDLEEATGNLREKTAELNDIGNTIRRETDINLKS
jgi:sec-independent protein translocase protein TatA